MCSKCQKMINQDERSGVIYAIKWICELCYAKVVMAEYPDATQSLAQYGKNLAKNWRN